jgi:type I restriction enzyme S subunit
MSFPRYPKYKDSGVEWLGEVPEHWDVCPAKRRLAVCSGGNEIKGKCASEPADGLFPAFSASGQDVWVDEHMFDCPGVVLSAVGARCGKTFRADGQWSAVANTHCLFPVEQADRDFLWYLTNQEDWWEKGGTAQPFVKVTETLARRWAFPPPAEQSIIASFLDRETAKIDALIAEQQRLIELLQEKRQAVISHAVTKGLNPDTPMKDSGIEWLGEVPEYWGTSRLKHATAKIVDCPHETPTYCDDGDYLVIRTPDLDDGRLLTAGMNRVDHAEYTDRTRRETLQAGDIVYSREGGRWGHAATVPASDRFCLGQRMMQFRSREDWDAGYLMWHLTSRHVYAQGEIDTAGAASPHVNVGTISNYRIASPPLDEQSHIARVLSSHAIGYDDLTNQAQNAIALLQERRSALISAAVTGQIDVRGLAGSEAA